MIINQYVLFLSLKINKLIPCGVREAGMGQGLTMGSDGGLLGARESLNVGCKERQELVIMLLNNGRQLDPSLDAY